MTPVGVEQHLQDPRDAIANYILRSAQSLSIDQKSVAAFFLLSHRIVKLFLIVAVLRNKPWAYPAFMTALGLPISYQSYKLVHVFSLGVTALTVLARQHPPIKSITYTPSAHPVVTLARTSDIPPPHMPFGHALRM